MFTGLVQELGTVQDTARSPDGVRLRVRTPLSRSLREGDSIAVNGVCLTVNEVDSQSFSAEVMTETLERSSLGFLAPDELVNLELPLRAGDPLGGHMVQGHVDGLGQVAGIQEDGFSRRVRVEANPELLRYVVVKGSITVDGVSLTVAEVDERSFTVSLIPETLRRTNLGAAEDGVSVNLEVDVLAKYVEKLGVGRP